MGPERLLQQRLPHKSSRSVAFWADFRGLASRPFGYTSGARGVCGPCNLSMPLSICMGTISYPHDRRASGRIPSNASRKASASPAPGSRARPPWPRLASPTNPTSRPMSSGPRGNSRASYVEREVRSILNVKDLRQFQTFVKMCASRVGQLLNSQNFGKRLMKSSKLYFVDIGLAARLLGMRSMSSMRRDRR